MVLEIAKELDMTEQLKKNRENKTPNILLYKKYFFSTPRLKGKKKKINSTPKFLLCFVI